MHNLKSMTGYGKSEKSDEVYSISIEIKSVNNKYLDIFIKCPMSINYLDPMIRNKVKDKINRGRVEINIKIKKISKQNLNIDINPDLIRSYKERLDDISLNTSIKNNLGLLEYLNLPDVITEVEDTEGIKNLEGLIFDTVDDAIYKNIKSREKEAESLIYDIVSRKKILAEKVDYISESLKEINRNIKKDYLKRLDDFIENANLNINEDRINQEIVILAEKSDITEEVIRLKTHLDNFDSIIENEEMVGRKLDFLIQEMNREINTIGSKTTKMDITETVIDFKSELEKIRQQIQNIE